MHDVKLKEKSRWWWLTFPFAHANYTAVGNTIYHPKGNPPYNEDLAHEMIHIRQQKQVGVAKFLFLYLFVLPLFWNPWRWRWEQEAYQYGSKWPKDDIIRVIRKQYGWLIFNRWRKDL